MKDFFISYCSKDEAWANWIAWVLESLGYSVIYQAKDFAPGDNFVLKMDESLRQSRRMIMVLTPNYLAARFTQPEWSAVIAKDPKSSERKLIPIRVRKCKPTILLSSIAYIDLVEKDEHAARQILSRELRKVAKPRHKTKQGAATRFPGYSSRRTAPASNAETHLLIAAESAFTNKVRYELLRRNKKLPIGIDFFGVKERDYEDYVLGLRDFLEDETAKYLLTVFPDEQRVQIDTAGLVKMLRSRGKHVLCFESGTKLIPSRRSVSSKTPVVCITTDHEGSVKLLIRHSLHTELNGWTKLHFVSVLGPEKNSIADHRRAVYNEFLARISLSRDLASSFKTPTWPKGNSDWNWNEIVEPVNRLSMIQTTFFRLRTWYRSEAKDMILNEFDSLNLADQSVRTCFLCGNDDIALGVRDALSGKLDESTHSHNTSYIGFDGIDEMLDSLQGQMEGATMKVRVAAMCEEAIRVINHWQSGNDVKSPLVKIPAHIKKSPGTRT